MCGLCSPCVYYLSILENSLELLDGELTPIILCLGPQTPQLVGAVPRRLVSWGRWNPACHRVTDCATGSVSCLTCALVPLSHNAPSLRTDPRSRGHCLADLKQSVWGWSGRVAVGETEAGPSWGSQFSHPASAPPSTYHSCPDRQSVPQQPGWECCDNPQPPFPPGQEGAG